jgi:uroporphyrinogen-III synthase
MRLVITRPEPDASRTAEALVRLGHEPILSPMLDIVLYPGIALPESPFQAVLATSSNAIRALALHTERARLVELPLFAVGDVTALEAKRAGFARARSAGGALDDLIERVRAELRPGDGMLLYAAGKAQAGDLAAPLRALGFRIATAIVYEARARTRLSNAAADALRRAAADGVLLYSRRSAAAFALALRAETLTPLSRSVVCFCLSAAVAEPLAPVSSGPIVVAERPDQISLFAAIERVDSMRLAGEAEV